jgi:hypothetical protein
MLALGNARPAMLAILSPEFVCMLPRIQLSFANGQCFSSPDQPA